MSRVAYHLVFTTLLIMFLQIPMGYSQVFRAGAQFEKDAKKHEKIRDDLAREAELRKLEAFKASGKESELLNTLSQILAEMADRQTKIASALRSMDRAGYDQWVAEEKELRSKMFLVRSALKKQTEAQKADQASAPNSKKSVNKSNSIEKTQEVPIKSEDDLIQWIQKP